MRDFSIILGMRYCWFYYVCIAASLYNQILLARGVEIFQDTFLVWYCDGLSEESQTSQTCAMVFVETGVF